MATMTISQFLLAEYGQLLLLLALLAAGAFFSGAETALFSLSRGQLYQLAHADHRLQRMAASLMRRPDNVLTTVLLGTNIVRILYFVWSSLLIIRLRGSVAHGATWASVAVVASLLGVIIFSEILPKTVCFLAARAVSPLAAPVLAAIGWGIRPVRRLLMAVLVGPLTRLLAPARGRRGDLSAEEIASLLALSEQRGLIGADQTELLKEVIDLSGLRAADIMVPRVDVVAHEVNSPVDGLIERIRHKRVTKIPVYEGDLDHVVGVVYAKRLLAETGKGLRELLEPAQFVPEAASLERVLLQFRATRNPLAVVVDEYGGTAGIVTLEDVLEEIVGEIVEEGDAERAPAVQQVGPGQWLVAGNLPIHEWAEDFGVDLAAVRFSTVGGFVISLLGHIPSVGAKATYRNVTFTVEAVRRRRISLLRVRVEEATP